MYVINSPAKDVNSHEIRVKGEERQKLIHTSTFTLSAYQIIYNFKRDIGLFEYH